MIRTAPAPRRLPPHLRFLRRRAPERRGSAADAAAEIPDSSQEARLLCALGESCSYGQPDRAADCFSRALALARALGDRRLEVRVLYSRAWMEYRQVKHPAFLETGAEAQRLACEIDDRELELVTGGRLALWRLQSGDTAGAEQLVRQLRAPEELRPSIWTDELQRAEMQLAAWRGRWSELRRILAVEGGEGSPLWSWPCWTTPSNR